MSNTIPTYQIAFSPPPQKYLRTYNRLLHPSSQSTIIPPNFLAAITARHNVFVKSQGLPFEYSLDYDDARSYHWTAIHSPIEDGDPDCDEAPARSLGISVKDLEIRTRNKYISNAIGTVRLIPFPQMRQHPPSGEHFNVPDPKVNPPVPSEEEFFQPIPAYVQDRATKFHDGIEPYVKVGRMCVDSEWRKKGVMSKLLESAFQWAGENPGLLVNREEEGLGEWKGLICSHAALDAVGAWEKNGFVVDEGIGRWYILGMPHVCMWRRVEVKSV